MPVDPRADPRVDPRTDPRTKSAFRLAGVYPGAFFAPGPCSSCWNCILSTSASLNLTIFLISHDIMHVHTN